jgi:stage V sporulation protein R
MRDRENWDTKAGLGKDKIFEVRKLYNDFTFIAEFFDQDFCEKYEYFEWAKFPNGEYKIISRDFKAIKSKLLKMYLNGGIPDVRLTDCNHRNRGWLLLEHQWDGRPLYEPWAMSVLTSIYALWNKTVVLSTKSDDETEIVYVCDTASDENKVIRLSREEYENR